MTLDQYLVLLYLFAIVLRYPRLQERWTAPLLRGTDWFFNVAVPPDFIDGPGHGILRRYRTRLFIPWMIEIPILVVLLISGHTRYFTVLILGTTLFTRFNFYAARQAAENMALPFELHDAREPVTQVSLSLQPRTTGNYTNRWVEAILAIAFAGSFAWLGYIYVTSPERQLITWLLSWSIFMFYWQAGLLLAKRAIVSAPTVAPANNAEQYLAWRESLRRFSTWLCDSARLLFVPALLANDILAVTKPRMQGGTLSAIMLGLFVPMAFVGWYEWRRRSAHLEVARRTRPAKLPALPGVPARLICFQPDYPMLLLRSANGYALNLASAPAKLAGLYLAGFAGLCVWLVHLAA
jgi:hypothetical protein